MKPFIKSLALVALLLSAMVGVSAQAELKAKPSEALSDAISPPAVPLTAKTSPLDLARAAFAAQGGNKFKELKSTLLTGSIEIYVPNSTTNKPASSKFAWVQSGHKDAP